MTQLYEILAVESSLEKVSRTLTQESIKTFSKDNLFKGFTKRLEMFNEDDQILNESSFLKLETTVSENLTYLMPSISKYWRTVLSKDMANQSAIADIVLTDGYVIAKDVPATFLLGLESKLGELRKLYQALPTLAPGIKWEADELERKGIYTNITPDISFKTETKTEFVEISPATKEHPAQVTGVKNVKNVGKYTTNNQSGMISSFQKAETLTRLDEMLSAVKKARMRANDVKITPDPQAPITILGYINGTI